jgi:hypothetical protein
MSNASLKSRYNYSGPVVNVSANPGTRITYEGCTKLCGSGNEYHPLLQAPFESNAFWRNVKAIDRWVGSPISSLTWIP